MSKKSQWPPHELTDDHRMELTNLVIELDALHRIFSEASRQEPSRSDEVVRAYRDVASLLRPICQRLSRLHDEINHH